MTTQSNGTMPDYLNHKPPGDIPLLILHPNYGNQHLLMPAILGQNGRRPVFLAPTRAVTNMSMFWELLSLALEEQYSVNLPAFSAASTPIKNAQIVTKALTALNSYVLYFDAFDLIDEEVIAPWLTAMLKTLPSGSQIVLGGRTFPSSLLRNRELREQAGLFPVDEEHMLLDYKNRPADRVLVEVYSLGVGRAYINGTPITQWDGILPRSLFFYFIDKGMVTRDEIFKTFWPDLSVREATNVFHVTKRKISEILGVDLTVYWSGFYRISPDIDLFYDSVKFIEYVQNSAVADDDEAVVLLQSAIALYRGAFLRSTDAEWAASRREELRSTYTESLTTLARIREQHGDLKVALGLYLRASSTLPHREDTVRSVMSLYARLGEPRRALEVYSRLVDDLKHSLGVTPDRRTTDLADQIRSGNFR